MNRHRNSLLLCVGVLAVFAAPLHGQIVTTTLLNDSFTDGIDDNAGNPLDSDWWTSSSTAADEFNPGPPPSLGLVTGTSGRGIHTIVNAPTLAVGESLRATFDFTTPATVSSTGNGFRIGLFDDLDRAGLDDHVSASSSSPNSLYDILPGYMVTLDINTGTEVIGIREHDTAGTGSGRLMATTSNFTQLDTGGTAYTFAANTDYTGEYLLTRTGSDDLLITFTLSTGAGVPLSTFSTTDSTAASFDYDFLGFHVNSNTFGSSNAAGTPDNGIDFSNVTVEHIAIPEPGTLALGLLGGALLIARRRK